MNRLLYTCILCGSCISIFEKGLIDNRYGVPGKFNIFFCNNCNLVQLFPILPTSELSVLYAKYYNYGGIEESKYIKYREAFFGSFLYSIWMFLDGDLSFYSRRGKGLLLDVGCNEGRGLRFYKKNGFNVEGVEVNERAACKGRKIGFTVHTQEIEELQTDKVYDVIVLSNVLEHSNRPNNMLNKVYSMLRSKGELWISCPNINSWQRSIFGKYWINWHVPFHMSHFSIKTLTLLLQMSGFEIKIKSQISPALWAAQSLIARLFAKAKASTKQMHNPILIIFFVVIIRVILFPLLCIGNWLGKGDCLTVIAKKIN